MKKFLLSAALLVVIVSIAWTQALDDYRTAQSGDWNNTATWERYNGTAW